MTTIDLLAAQTHVDSPVSPAVWGIGVLVGFLVLLLIVLAFGKGRPHA